MLKYFFFTSLICLVTAGRLDYLPGGPQRQQSHQSGTANTAAASSPSTAHSAPASGPPAGLDRQFFFFNAPEESPVELDALKQFNSATSRKKQQIIFIKPPENRAYERALQNIAQNAAESQQTKIYVLQREPDYAGLRQKFQAAQHASRAASRPDVHFVKYGTPQEAQHAQQSITRQYDALPGKSSHYNLNAPAIDSRGGSHNNKPVDKGYAKNFLPSGVDVVPGSSYIPPAFI